MVNLCALVNGGHLIFLYERWMDGDYEFFSSRSVGWVLRHGDFERGLYFFGAVNIRNPHSFARDKPTR